MDRTKAETELGKKLHPSNVKARKQGGASVQYIEGWHAIAEANAIFGHFDWSRETVDLRCVTERERLIGQAQKPGWGVTYIAKVRVVADGVTREGVGAGHGIGTDLGECHESAIKEAETDAMKRALSTFGWRFGLALYDKEREHVGTEPPPPPPPYTPEQETETFARMAAVVDAAPDSATLAKFIAQRSVQEALERMGEPKRLEFRAKADARAKELSGAREAAE